MKRCLAMRHRDQNTELTAIFVCNERFLCLGNFLKCEDVGVIVIWDFAGADLGILHPIPRAWWSVNMPRPYLHLQERLFGSM